MRNSSGGPRGGITNRKRAFGLALLLACAIGAQVGTAQASTLKFTFTDGRINLGSQKGLHMIDPAVPDPPAVLTLKYDEATDAFDWPALYAVDIKPKEFNNVPTGQPFPTHVDVRATFTGGNADGSGSATGTYNPATGALDTTTLPVTARVSLWISGSPHDDANLLTRCRISPVPLPLDSTGSLVNDTMNNGGPTTYNADTFDAPDGAGVATWMSLPASVFEAGAGNFCSNVDSLAAGPGGIWLKGTAAVTPGDPTPPNTGGGGTTVTPITPTTPAAVTPAGVTAKKCKKGQKLVKGKCVKKKKKK